MYFLCHTGKVLNSHKWLAASRQENADIELSTIMEMFYIAESSMGQRCFRKSP